MVVPALFFGGVVGVVISAAFLYFEVGRFAEPQVPRTLFDERKEVIAYTAGLFVGLPLSLGPLLFFTALSNGALFGIVAGLALLVGGAEVAQRWALRSVYFGSTEAGPFYVLGLRTGIGGILAIVLVGNYLGSASVSALGVAVVLAQSVAVLLVSVASCLLSLPARPSVGRLGGGPFSGGLLGGVAFLLLGFGVAAGPVEALVAALLAAGGSAYIYRRAREAALGSIAPPRAAEPDEPAPTTSFGRTDR